MLLDVKMLHFHATIRDETPEVMVLDSNVLYMRLYLQGNHECDKSLIVFVNCYVCYWFFEKTTQYRRGVSLKFEYELNFLHNTHKR